MIFLAIRHPERSEANGFLFSCRTHPSAVEGPRRFDAEMTATDSFGFMHGPRRRLSLTASSVALTVQVTPRRSFDFGSATRPRKTGLPLAFAQDDGTLVFGARDGYPGDNP
jgi:hypothetical protein